MCKYYLALMLSAIFITASCSETKPIKCYKLTDHNEKTEIIKIQEENLWVQKQCNGLNCSIQLHIYQSDNYGAPLIARYDNLASFDEIQCK